MKYLEEFGEFTDKYYDECSRGLSRLEQIIVSISDQSLTGWCRAYFVLAAYSYWERFFRLSLEEFLNSLNKAGFNAAEIDIRVVARVRRKELKRNIESIKVFAEDYAKTHKQSYLVSDAKILESASSHLTSSTFQIRDPKSFIETRSNVRFDVIEENFKNFNLSFSNIIQEFNNGRIDVKKKLGEFVDTRNNISHGSVISEISSQDWADYLDLLYKLMNLLQMELIEALSKSPSHRIFASCSKNKSNDIFPNTL